MKVVIVGAGDVGQYVSAVLSNDGYDVTVVERKPETCVAVDEAFNVRVVRGNGSSAQVLQEAGVGEADYFLAMTSDDLTNLVASSVARALGAKTILTRIHDQAYVDNPLVNYQVHFGIDHIINPEGLTAVALAKIIRNPARVAVENFARGQIEAHRLRVDPNAKVVGKTLRELNLPAEVRFGYYQRGGEENVPEADTEVQAGDIVTVFGPPSELYKLREKIDPGSTSQIIRVVVVGGGETGVALLRLLSSPRFRVRVIEKDPARCQVLAQRFPRVTILNGDGTSLRLLEDEQIAGVDYFVAVTGADEQNIMSAVLAVKLGAKHVQAILNKSDYEGIIENLRQQLGLETIVSPRTVTAQEVLRYLSREPYVELFRFPQQSARIIEIVVSPESPCVGKTLREVQWPRGSVAVALQHKFKSKVPSGDDHILAGDRMVFITREGNLRALLGLLRPA